MLDRIERQIERLEESLGEYAAAVRELAEAEHTYRLARAKAWVNNAGLRTVAEREKAVEADTLQERFERDLAEGKAQALLERVRVERQVLSAFQTAANLPPDI